MCVGDVSRHQAHCGFIAIRDRPVEAEQKEAQERRTRDQSQENKFVAANAQFFAVKFFNVHNT